ncbi:MAG: glycosyl hydrolase 2 galactose-binding domain-containing protein [Armatimonadota bacterium]
MGRYLRVCMLTAAMWCAASAFSAPVCVVWREAETADEANFALQTQSGDPAVLSGGRWLAETLGSKEEVAAKLGAGRQLRYRLAVPQSGRYTLWLRMGFEWVRPPLQWRVDSGGWHTVSPEKLSTNLIGIGPWAEVGWIRAGDVTLIKGRHTLDLKADRPGSDGRFLLALDVVALVMGQWHPDGPLKPREMPSGALDRRAQAHVHRLAGLARSAKRITVPLSGPWQVCRDDDMDMDLEPYAPLRKPPASPIWRGVNVPCDLKSVPALNLAHRVWYRCKVHVPAALAGHSFVLDFTGTNWIASVVVNGTFVGWRKSTRVPWQCDITRAVKPGRINEIMVGVKSPWYAIDAKFHKSELDKLRNVPVSAFNNIRFVAPVYPSTKGDADGTEWGITDPVDLVVAGPAYVQDVFVKTSVSRKSISADVSIANSTGRDLSISVQSEAVFEGTGQTEKRLKPVVVRVPARQTRVVTLQAEWPDAKLWWPDDDPAHMYRLRTMLSAGGRPMDVHEQTFGFREVTIDGVYIRINGLRRNFWNLLGGLQGATPQDALKRFRMANNRFERFSADLNLQKMLGPRRRQLDWFDRHGIAGRLSTMIDGMFITYDLNNPVTWENFREHVEQVVRAYRNHPSIIVYSLENELLFINGRLGGTGDVMDRLEAEARRLVETAHRLDPTRPCMLDGSGALKDNSLEICCTHYAEDGFHPDNAYPVESIVSVGRWSWDRKRPYAAGEIAYFSGSDEDHAWIGGGSAAQSHADARRAYAKYVRYILERYRWNDVAMIFPWVGQDGFEDCWAAMSPLAAFVREYNTAFFGGDRVTRTVKVFNDTFSREPVTFTWSVEVEGRRIAGGTETLTIEPGFGKELTLSFTAPQVAVRTAGKLVLEVTRRGDRPFRDAKDLAFFPKTQAPKLKRQVYVLGSEEFAVKLAQWGVPAQPVEKVSDATPGGILLVAPDVLADGTSAAPFVEYASQGGRVVCLEQEFPFEGEGLPSSLARAKEERKNVSADFTFGQGMGSPILEGLSDTDLSNWAGDSPTAKVVWNRPSGSARAWIVCGPALKHAALVEMPCRMGEIIACQLRVGAKLDIEPAARVLLVNMLKRADAYEPPSGGVVVVAPQNPKIAQFVRSLGCKVREAGDLGGIGNLPFGTVLIVHASRTNMEALLSRREEVGRFVNAGGWVMLWGLEPDGLAAYNELLGTKHHIREFRVEAVRLLQDVLTSGLDSPDVRMYTDEVIAPWSGLKLVSPDVFTFCVDGADVAPFCFGPPENYSFQRGSGPYNLVNGLTNADFWWYIDQIPYEQIPKSGLVLHTFSLPSPCKLDRVVVWNNANYDTIRELEIRVDEKEAARAELPDSYDSVEIKLNGMQAERSVTLVARSVRVRQDKKLIGLDLVKIDRELPDWYAGRVYPLVDVGGLVRYPRGRGGYVLNQLKLTGSDTRENAEKKRRIVSVILQNLGVAFSDGPLQNEG